MGKVALFGGSGFIGKGIQEYLHSQGHEVALFQRKSQELPFYWDPEKGVLKAEELNACAFAINLAGAPLIGYWSEQKKRAIKDSRVKATLLISEELDPSIVLFQASAVGYYGDQGDESVDEAGKQGSGFLAEVCHAWEEASLSFQKKGGRRILLRIGMVLDETGGALARMKPAFQWGLGGRIGDGRQWVSWIALEDLVRAIGFLMGREKANGVYNLVAPQPVTSVEFTSAVAEVLGRPHFVSMPAVLLKTLLPGLAEELFLASLRAVPARLLNEGFRFNYASLRPFLEQEL